jgi:HAD superfamily hydrolase (TIGR01509 family)
VTVVRACLVDVYDTILESHFEKRVEYLVAPLGIAVADWLAEWLKTREDRDRGRLTTAEAIRLTLPACGLEPDPALVDDLLRRDAEYANRNTILFEDTVPFLTWLRSRGVLIALVSNCSDATRPQLERLGLLPLVDSVILSCEIGSIKPYPEMYVTPLDELGVAAVDAVFIDDQPRFCAGAEAVGVRPIQIARGEPDGYVSPLNFPVVRSLRAAQSLPGLWQA